MFSQMEGLSQLSVGGLIFRLDKTLASGIQLEVSSEGARLEIKLPLIGARSAWASVCY